MTLEGVGGVRTERIPAAVGDHRPNVRRVRVDYDAGTFELGLPDGSTVAVESPVDGVSDSDLLGHRVVVYLDQNHWSTIADWRSGGRSVNDEDACAAAALSGLVDAERVVLPVSAGHLLETSALYGGRRADLACAVLALSRGWHMRSPWFVRRAELTASYERQAPIASSVFTIDSGDVFARETRRPRLEGVPAAFADLTARMIMATSLFDTLLDPERLPDEGGHAALESWAQSQAEAARQTRAEGISGEAVRQRVHALLLVDLIHEVVDIWGPDKERFQAWIDRSHDDVARMPSLSRTRAVLFARFRNGSSWSANDFTDIHYLSCAAGYADLVVGENRTIGDLRTATGTSSGAQLATTLPAAIAVLAEMGIAPGKESPAAS